MNLKRMKIINKFLYSASVLSLSLLVMTSCHDEVEYVPASPEGGAQVYFPSNESTQYNLSADGSSFSIVVSRANDAEAVTVPITVTPMPNNTSNDAFTFPTQVSFSAGEKTATIVVNYVIDLLEYEDAQQFQVTLDEASATAYGASSIVITAVYPQPWTSLGQGIYADEGWWLDDNNPAAYVTFYQNDLDPNLFRVSNPYNWLSETEGTYFEFRILQEGEEIREQTVNRPGLVTYDLFLIDWSPDYDSYVYLAWPGDFTNLQDQSNWVYNYVVDWQENGLPGEIHLSPMYYLADYGGAYNYSTSEFITMIFPGYESLDTSVEVTYSGMLHKPDDTYEVVCYVDLGQDATSAKVTIINGSSVPTEVINMIDDGTFESTTITQSQQLNFSFAEDNPEGPYTIVAVVYLDDEVRGYDYANFTYTPGGKESYSLVSEGIYTYLSDMWAEDGEVVADLLELYESDTTPGKFRIPHWCNDRNFQFTMDDDDNIMVADQETGVSSQYGMIYACDMVTYVGDTSMGYSYYEDGVYYFDIIYYVADGYFAYGYETFEPSTVGTRSAAPRASYNAYNFEKISKKVMQKGKNQIKMTRGGMMRGSVVK